MCSLKLNKRKCVEGQKSLNSEVQRKIDSALRLPTSTSLRTSGTSPNVRDTVPFLTRTPLFSTCSTLAQQPNIYLDPFVLMNQIRKENKFLPLESLHGIQDFSYPAHTSPCGAFCWLLEFFVLLSAVQALHTQELMSATVASFQI